MNVRLNQIPAEGLDVDFDIDANVMGKSMAKEDEVADFFDQEVHCKLHLDLRQKDVFISGSADTMMHPVCARCSEAFDRDMHADLAITCVPEPSSNYATVDSYQESEEGLVYYRNEEIDLSEVVREQMLLLLPIRFLCSDDCKGLCPNCGANLNNEDHDCGSQSVKAG